MTGKTEDKGYVVKITSGSDTTVDKATYKGKDLKQGATTNRRALRDTIISHLSPRFIKARLAVRKELSLNSGESDIKTKIRDLLEKSREEDDEGNVTYSLSKDDSRMIDAYLRKRNKSKETPVTLKTLIDDTENNIKFKLITFNNLKLDQYNQVQLRIDDLTKRTGEPPGEFSNELTELKEIQKDLTKLKPQVIKKFDKKVNYPQLTREFRGELDPLHERLNKIIYKVTSAETKKKQ